MKKLIYILTVIFAFTAKAQDIHFSQFYNAPMLLNPAMAGKMDGNIRVTGNYRRQWAGISRPFVTSALSADLKMMERRLNGNALGAGISLFQDKSGTGELTYFKFNGNVAFHKKLTPDDKHRAGIGVQAGFFQKSIDFYRLRFASQFEDVDFDRDKSSGESFSNTTQLTADFNGGFYYQYQDEQNFSFTGGASFFHINRPNESLLGVVDRLSMRSVIHGSAHIPLTENTTLLPSAQFMNEARARELVAGAAASYTLQSEAPENVKLLVGGWYRFSDAVILMGGAKYKNWQLSLSYDINVSALVPASLYRGGPEISLIYEGNILFGKDKLPVIYSCPRL